MIVRKYARVITIVVLLVVWATDASGSSGHSPEYQRYLNQPKPEWMVLGRAITTMRLDGDLKKLFPPSLDGIEMQVTRHSVVLPTKDVSIEFEHSVHEWHAWDDPRAKWLSPDGEMLVVSAGSDSHLYEILNQGGYRELDVDLPELTFDVQPRGILSGWRWAADGVLLAEAEIENPQTGEHESSRIYVYHLNRKTLRHVDLDGAGLEGVEEIEVISVSSDPTRLLLKVRGELVGIEADLDLQQPLGEGTAIGDYSSSKFPNARPPNNISGDVNTLTNDGVDHWNDWYLIVGGLLGIGIIVLFIGIRKGQWHR